MDEGSNEWQAYPIVLPSSTPQSVNPDTSLPSTTESNPQLNTLPNDRAHSESETIPSNNEETTDEKEQDEKRARRSEKRKRALAIYRAYENDGPAPPREWNPHRQIRGCPHWRQGCAFESNVEEHVKAHVATCPFEAMKSYIAKKDAQITHLTAEVNTLKTSVHHLTRILGELISQQIPPIGRFNRSLSGELYNPSTALGSDGIRRNLSPLSEEILEVNQARHHIKAPDIDRYNNALAGGMKVVWTQTPAPRVLDIHGSPISRVSSSHALLLPPTLPITLRESSAELGIAENLMSIHNTTPIRDIALFQECIFTAGVHGIQIWQLTSAPSLRFVAKLTSEDCFAIAAGDHPQIHLYTGHHNMIRMWNYDFTDGSLHFGSFDVETGSVRCLVMSGPYVYSSAETESIQVWRTTNFDSRPSLQRQTILRGHHALITVLCVGGDYLFSGSKDCSVLVWSLSTHKCVRKLSHPDGVLSLCMISSTTEIQLIKPVARTPYTSAGRSDDEDMTALVPQTSPTTRLRFSTLPSTPLALPPSAVVQETDTSRPIITSIHPESPPHSPVLVRAASSDSIGADDKQGRGSNDVTSLTICVPPFKVEIHDSNPVSPRFSLGHALTDQEVKIQDAPSSSSPPPPLVISNSSPSRPDTPYLSPSQISSLQDSGILPALNISPNSRPFGSQSDCVKDATLVVGGMRGVIQSWKLSDWSLARTLRGHGDKVTSLHSFGGFFASGYASGKVTVLSGGSYNRICSISSAKSPVRCFQCLHTSSGKYTDGVENWIVGGFGDGSLRLYIGVTGGELSSTRLI